MSEVAYFYARSRDAEHWTAADSLDEIKSVALEDEYQEVWIGEPVEADPAEFMPDADDVLETFDDNAAVSLGCEEPPFDYSADAIEELEQLLKSWARQHCKQRWWEVGNRRRVDLGGPPETRPRPDLDKNTPTPGGAP